MLKVVLSNCCPFWVITLIGQNIGTNCTYKKATASRGPRQVVAKPPELIACAFVPT